MAARVSSRQVKAIKRQTGTTVNDVLVSAMAGLQAQPVPNTDFTSRKPPTPPRISVTSVISVVQGIEV